MLGLLLSAFFRCAAVGTVADARIQKAVDFLSQYGWATDADSCETTQVQIPAQFGKVYERYNDLQRAQGFDLNAYRGAVLTRYSFRVGNATFCDGGPVIANVFFKDDAIVAADLCDIGIDGHIRGVVDRSFVDS